MFKKSLYVFIVALICVASFSIYKLSNSVEKIESYFVTKDFQSKFNVNSSSSDRKEENLEKLREENEDIVGWIAIPDTEINFPIVQAEDNEYYQEHTLNNRKNTNGTIYMDYRNNTSINSNKNSSNDTDNDTNIDTQNFIIYGNDLFDDLTAYKYQDYFEDHREITFVTSEGEYKAFIFSVYEVNQHNAVLPVSWESAKAKNAYLQESRTRSYVLSNIFIDQDESIVTLVSQTDWSEDILFVIQAVLMYVDDAPVESSNQPLEIE